MQISQPGGFIVNGFTKIVTMEICHLDRNRVLRFDIVEGCFIQFQ